MENFEAMVEAFEEMRGDAKKWEENQVKAAAKRLRKNSMIIIKAAKALRKEISAELREL